MTALLLVLPAVSLLVLAAHFLRAGAPLPMLVVLGALACLFVPRRWAARTAQGVLLLGALEWVRTTVVLTGERMSEGVPYLRMAVILGVVAALAAGAALTFQSHRLRRWYRMDGDTGPGGAR